MNKIAALKTVAKAALIITTIVVQKVIITDAIKDINNS